MRTKTIFLADEEKENQEIALRLGVSQQIVSKWRKRFSEERKEGLQDEPQLGKPKKFDYEVQLRIMEIAHSRPKKITHWSTRELAKKINKKLAIEIAI